MLSEIWKDGATNMNQMNTRGNRLLNGATGFIFALMAFALLSGECWAQKYRTMKPASKGKYKRDVGEMLTGAYDKTLASDYYFKSLLAELASGAPRAEGVRLDGIRVTILKDLTKIKSQSTHQQLVRDLVTWCGGIASTKQRFHPIAQYNAMLILGQLNDREAVSYTHLTLPTKA